MRCEQSIVPNAPCFPCLLPSPLPHHPWASHSGASGALPVVPFYSFLVMRAHWCQLRSWPAPPPSLLRHVHLPCGYQEEAMCHPRWVSQGADPFSHTTQTPGHQLGYAAVWASGPASCLPVLPDRRKVDRTPLASPPCPRRSCLQHRPHQTVSLRFCPGRPPAPCSARPMDSLFEELVISGLLKKSETVPLKDYIGETSPQCLPQGGTEERFPWPWPSPKPTATPAVTLLPVCRAPAAAAHQLCPPPHPR